MSLEPKPVYIGVVCKRQQFGAIERVPFTTLIDQRFGTAFHDFLHLRGRCGIVLHEGDLKVFYARDGVTVRLPLDDGQHETEHFVLLTDSDHESLVARVEMIGHGLDDGSEASADDSNIAYA